MKKQLLLAGIIALAIMGCKKPGCIDPLATNFNESAKTDDGTCEYPVEDHRTPLLGYYLIEDSAFFNGTFVEERTYSLQVRLQSGETEITDKIIFENLWGSGNTFYGNVNKSYDLVFPSQPISPGSGLFFTGTGSFSGHFVSFKTSYSYTVDGMLNTVDTKGVGDK